MRKCIVILIVFLMVLSFSACSININIGDDDKDDITNQNTSIAETDKDLDEIDKNIKSFTDKVNKLVKEADNAKVQSTREESLKLYRKIDKKIDDLDHEISSY